MGGHGPWTAPSTEIKILGLLGLAHRAGKLALGAEATKKAIERGKARALVVARDITEATRGKLDRLARRKRIPLWMWGSKREIGSHLGREEVGVVGILDDTFAEPIGSLIAAESPAGGAGPAK